MSTTFTTTHIHNTQNLTKAQFKKAFTDMMKAKGYTASDEENAALTYTLAFSPDRKWVTVLTDGADTRREAAELANGLKAHAVVIDIVDSDFAELSLFDEAGKHTDTLTLGDSYLEDTAPMGDPAAWQPLLRGSWEQVQEIQKGSYTFAEDALAQFAPLIGMDSGNILLDNDSADDNAVVLHFKKAAEEKLTLNGVFKQVFGEKLIPMGFKFMCGKSFVRVVNNEVIQTVSCVKENSIGTFNIHDGSDVIYNIRFAISTVYDDEILLKPDRYCSGFKPLHRYYIENYDIYGRDEEFLNKIMKFGLKSYDKNHMLNSMTFALEAFVRTICPLLEKAPDLESNLFYFIGFSSVYIWFNLCLKLDDYTSYAERVKVRELNKLKYDLEHGMTERTADKYDEYVEKIINLINKNIGYLDEITNDKDEYKKMIKGFEENKIKNLTILRQLLGNN